MPQIHFLHRNRRYLNADFAELPYLAFEDYESETLGTIAILNGWAFGGKVITYAGGVASEDFETSTLSNNTPPGPDYGWTGTGIVYGLYISSQPASVLTVNGTTISFSIVAAQGLSPYTYQWKKSGVPLVNGGTISGATAATLTITGVSSGDYAANAYACTVTDAQGQTVDSTAASLTDVITDWSARVVTNGGAAPSAGTKTSLAAFVSSCISDGTWTLIKSFCFFPPDNLTAAITPVLVGGGNDPWTNTSFVSGDLTINGLKGNGASTFLNTGVIPGTAFASDNDGGLSVYNYKTSLTGIVDMGCEGSAFNVNSFHIYSTWSDGICYGDLYGAGTGRISASNPLAVGYASNNRTASNAHAVYTARSNLAHNTLVSGAGISDQTRSTTRPVFCFATNANGSAAGFSDRRMSFAAIHSGFSSAQSSNFFSRVHQLRKDLKGGYSFLTGDDVVNNWSARVVAAGGSAPAAPTISALKTFVAGLVTDGILEKLIMAHCFAPDSLTAAITPLIGDAYLADSSVNSNFVSGDLTVNGLLGNASNKCLTSTAIVPSTSPFTKLSMGVYAFTVATGVTGVDFSGGDASHFFQLVAKYSDGNSYFYDNQNGVTVAASGLGGFYAQNRTSSTDHRAWFANSTHSWAQIGATDTNAFGAYSPWAPILFANNAIGTAQQFASNRLSFAFLADSMSATDLQNLYNRVQTLRTSLGGGFV